MTKLLLEEGTNMSMGNDSGMKCLRGAAWAKAVPILQVLLDRRANIEAKTTSSRTPLIVVASEGADAVVSWLIEMGPDIAVRDKAGGTSLYLGVQGRSKSD